MTELVNGLNAFGMNGYKGLLWPAQQRDFFFVRRKQLLRVIRGRKIGSFQDLGDVRKVRVMDYGMQCRKSDTALSDIGMPVFGGSLFVFTVIDVEDTEPVFILSLS